MNSQENQQDWILAQTQNNMSSNLEKSSHGFKG